MKPVADLPKCPTCGSTLTHDTWEDMFSCQRCRVFYYPEEVGRVTDESAGIFKIGDPHGK